MFDYVYLDGTDLVVDGNIIEPWTHPNMGKTFSSRAGYKYNDVFIKVDVEEREYGVSQSVSEWQLWNSLDNNDKMYFVESLSSGFSTNGHPWVAQPLLKSAEMFHSKKMPTCIVNMLDKYLVEDVWGTQGWCYYDGKPVIYDYGLNSYVNYML